MTFEQTLKSEDGSIELTYWSQFSIRLRLTDDKDQTYTWSNPTFITRLYEDLSEGLVGAQYVEVNSAISVKEKSLFISQLAAILQRANHLGWLQNEMEW